MAGNKDGSKKKKHRFFYEIYRNTPQEIPICEGISIDESMYDKKENRIFTLFLKGVMVYLLTMGSLGAYLSSIGCEYNAVAVNIVAFTTAIICSMLYYSYLVENLGYLVFFIIFAFVIYVLQKYISSGFNAILNDTYERVSSYFDSEGVQQYAEQYENRYLTITICASIISVIYNILLNNYISRSVRYIAAAVIVLFFNMVPIYMELEPDFIYLIMLVAGFLICYLIRSGQHYLLHRSESIYKYFSRKPLYLRVFEWLRDGFKKLKKRLKGEQEFPWESLENQNKEKKNKDDLEIKTLRYSIDAKSMGQMCLIGLCIVIVVVAISNIISPKDDYKDTHEDNRFKQASVAILANAVSLGIGSVFNYYENNGGLSGGVLGGIGTIRFDYQPDITVKFAPYSYDTIYVKNFIGQSYKPYRNRWMQPMDYKEPTEQFYYETKALKKAYDEGAEYSAKGKMVVENKAGNMGIYVPYYSGGENDFLRYGISKEYTYYPRFAESLATVEPREISDAYLFVPDDNMEAIRDFATEAGLSSSDEPLVTVQKVADYYQENIPYTIRPGATSYREDFINYFLTKNRKGYCAHFASAATLLFRYCGIPARYCEGYAIPYEDVTGDGEIINNEKYSDYYEGYSEIGETAVIEVSASDANAHAWVEIYTEQYGWIVADVTPSAGEEDAYDDFWSVFDRITGRRNGSDSEDSTATGPNINLSIDKKTIDFITYAIVFLVMLFVVIIVTIPSYRFLRKKVIYARSNTSDKLIIKYNDQIRRWQRIEKRSQFVNKKDNEAEKNLESTLSDCINYRSQVEYLEKNNTIVFTDKSLKERMISILEKAGFSNSIISDEEFKFVNRYLNVKQSSAK